MNVQHLHSHPPSNGTNNIYVVHRGSQNETGTFPNDLGTKNYVFRGVISTPTDGKASNLRFGVNSLEMGPYHLVVTIM